MKDLTTLDICSPIAVVMLLLCQTSMPYGYFTLVRYSMTVLSIAWAISLWNEKRSWAWIAIAVAGLFQPFFKLVLGRTIWNAIDIVVAILLILLVFYRTKKKIR